MIPTGASAATGLEQYSPKTYRRKHGVEVSVLVVAQLCRCGLCPNCVSGSNAEREFHSFNGGRPEVNDDPVGLNLLAVNDPGIQQSAEHGAIHIGSRRQAHLRKHPTITLRTDAARAHGA